MSLFEDNTALTSVGVDKNSNISSQSSSRPSQQWLEAENEADDMRIEFSDDDEYELTRLTPSIEKAIRLSILSIGQDSDLDSNDESNKNEEKQKKRKRDHEVSLNESCNYDATMDENSMDTDHILTTSYNILEPMTKKIKLDDLEASSVVQEKCIEMLNNSQEINDFLEKKPKDSHRKILKVKLFKPDRKMQLLIKKALQKNTNINSFSEALKNKENIRINEEAMIKGEPNDMKMEVDSIPSQSSAEYINYEFLQTTYSLESMAEDTAAIVTRNDDPMETQSYMNVEKIKQENDDMVDDDSLLNVHYNYDVFSSLTPTNFDVEMSEIDSKSDVIVREIAMKQQNFFNDDESSLSSVSDDDSDYDNVSRLSNDDVQPDSILFARPTTSQPNQVLGERALETLQRQQELTLDCLQNLHGSLVSRPSDTDHAEDPPGLFTPLMLHQQQALAWLLWREQQKPPGGILADDMGLGKTLSMISLILARFKQAQKKRKQKLRKGKFGQYRGGTLVVCPASLLAQWQNEIFDHCLPRTLTVEIYHGPNRELSVKKLAKKDVVITTYNILAHAVGCYRRSTLFKIHWDRVILDEAHVIRNHKTRMCKAACELLTDNRWALTGTPIHNKQMDLYSILKFLKCSPFDDLKIWRRWVDNKDKAGYHRLTTLMKTLLLRRTKKELIAKKMIPPLPEQSIQIIPIELDPEERVVYEKVVIYSRTLFAQFLHQQAEKKRRMAFGAGYKPVEDNFEFDEFNDAQKLLLATHADIRATEILVLLTRLRQICCHPSLIHAMLDREDVQQSTCNNSVLNFDLLNKINTFKDLDVKPHAESTADAITNRIKIENLNEEEMGISKRVTENLLTRTNPVFDQSRLSSKHRAILKRVKEIIENSDNDKVIIVSQWTSHLKIIAKNLESISGATYKSFDGSVAVENRQKIINKINTPGQDPRILLLSLTAGGVGLNLVGANHLMLVDIHWNPQLETQTQDRIYRFGQKKNVYIYRFICSDSIEERIQNLQEYKLDIAQNILAGTGRVNTKLTLEDFKSLFGFN